MLKTFNQMTAALATVVVLAACALILSCSSDTSEAQTNPCPDGTSPWTEYRLFFGSHNADNEHVVSPEQWEAFLADPITREFPDGLTVLDARGQYRPPGGDLIKEETKVLIILVPGAGTDARPKINGIIEDYKNMFDQAGVLLEINPTCAKF